MRTIPTRLWLLAACSGVLQLLPFPIAGPTPYWRRVFCWFCLTPLLWALCKGVGTGEGTPLGAKKSAALAYLSGVIFYLGNCYWIYPTMHIYGNIPSTASLGILLLFALYVGLYHALFGAVFGWLRERSSVGITLAAVPFLWVAVELARARITGFPWDLLGYTQVDNLTLTKIVPLTGVMGLSLVIAVVNVLWLVRWKRWVGPAVAVVFVAVMWAMQGGSVVPPPLPSTAPQAVLLQDNLSVGSSVSRYESRDELLATFTAMSVEAAAKPGQPVSLILWPEAPADFVDRDPAFRKALGALAVKENAAVIADSIGIVPTGEGQRPKLYNSASFFAPDGSYAGHYDKMHLVPFGEYTPFRQLLFFAGHLLDNVGTFTPGAVRTLFHTQRGVYGVFICYESIFGDEIRELSRTGAELLVNLSDDGWYGDSSAPWEHLDMVRMRAIENHRWVLRATNTGVTSAIDTRGILRASMPRHIRGAIRVGFELESDTTIYTRYGDWIAWVCALISAGFLLGARLRDGKINPDSTKE